MFQRNVGSYKSQTSQITAFFIATTVKTSNLTFLVEAILSKVVTLNNFSLPLRMFMLHIRMESQTK
jgi:hypothetical protein